ncbi:hypothetical protein ACRAWD_16575 [Caulobacter segnis]
MRAIGVSNFLEGPIEELRIAGLPCPTPTRSNCIPGRRSRPWSPISRPTRSRRSPIALWRRSPPGARGRTAPRPTR